MNTTIVIGAGLGGLSAAIALASRGVSVTVCEAKATLGGLAQSLEADGVTFDGGPYILLDPLGLAFAFEQLHIDIESLNLQKVDDCYQVDQPEAPPIRIRQNLTETVEGIERVLPGQGVAYRQLVTEMTHVYQALAPLQRQARPSALKLLVSGALWHAPFLLRSLDSIFERAGLSAPMRNAVGIWTHVAGQSLKAAPSPLALVPAMIHGPGCFVPRGGVAAIVDAVVRRAQALDVTFRTSARVEKITSHAGQVTGVLLSSGEHLAGSRVISDANGVSTLVELGDVKAALKQKANALPLQSPGVAAYVLANSGPPHDEPYLRFRVTDDPVAPCRLLVRPSVLEPSKSGPVPVRIVAPMAHADATRLQERGQHQLLDAILQEPWVRQAVGPFRELARLVPATWGQRHALYRDSMNPVMTAAFMRQGRLPHRLNHPKGLFLVGSSTHPGQWVSFCLISGLLGAHEALRP